MFKLPITGILDNGKEITLKPNKLYNVKIKGNDYKEYKIENELNNCKYVSYNANKEVLIFNWGIWDKLDIKFDDIIDIEIVEELKTYKEWCIEFNDNKTRIEIDNGKEYLLNSGRLNDKITRSEALELFSKNIFVIKL